MRTRHFSSSDPVPSKDARHQPVLLHEVVNVLDIQSSDIVVDATLGGAGHAKELVKGLGGNGLFIGFDADHDAIERAQSALKDSKASVHLICANFEDIEAELRKRGITKVMKVLFDLGWSSYQLDSGLPGQGRGFSFMADEPLLMTYASRSLEGTLTAREIVNTWNERAIADIIFGFGEERYSRRIAKAIVARRAKKPFETSRDLAEVVKESVPAGYRYGRIHPATRTFQALRIAVNDELDVLKEGLAAAWRLLSVGGRIAVISFHSIEDRIVKQAFAEWKEKGEGALIAKKPIRPSAEEVVENPRARSAKLRVIEKIPEIILYESENTKNKQARPFDLSGEV